MRRPLRDWFACRFSLGRLAVAAVFLSVFVGLNTREIGPVFRPHHELRGNVHYMGSVCAYYGWPFPFMNAYNDEALFRNIIEPYTPGQEYDSENAAWWGARWDAACAYRYPLTHQTYRIRVWDRLSPAASIALALTNVVFAFTVVSLILFLQIPRRKVAAKVE